MFRIDFQHIYNNMLIIINLFLNLYNKLSNIKILMLIINNYIYIFTILKMIDMIEIYKKVDGNYVHKATNHNIIYLE